tara:strand:- start:231 stop:545 length:315 start_codon:yes stop_codon:yes gene_type:complete
MQTDEFSSALKRIGEGTRLRLEALQSHRNVRSIRQLGTIGAVELNGGHGYFAANGLDIPAVGRKHGVLLRPLGNVIYSMPPLSTTEAQLQKIYDAIDDCLEKWS